LTQFDKSLGPEPAHFNSGPAALRSAARAGAAYVLVFNVDGELILRDVPNAPAINIADQDWFQVLAKGDVLVISPFIPRSASGGRTFAIGRRLERDGRFAGAAMIFPGADILAEAWSAVALGPQSTLTLVRDDGWLVNRHPVLEQPVNVASHELFTKHLPLSPTGVYSLTASPLDGKPRRVAYQRVQGAPLIAVASVASTVMANAYWRRTREEVWIITPFGIALVAICIWMGLLLRRQERDRFALAAALGANRILLQEIHHRVKNNFQAVIGLIRLQPGPADGKEQLAQRIAAMSAVHQHMYESDQFAAVAADEYLGKLLAALRTDQSGVQLVHDIAPLRLTVDQAFPLGLIINELVVNAYKYAFPANRTGLITVRLSPIDGELAELTVSDNGVGYDVTRNPGMGTRLIRSLAAQLGGEGQFVFSSGTRFSLRFPVVAAET
jgi:two-component sensor histidine kinase